jgi:hypothetical protein
MTKSIEILDDLYDYLRWNNVNKIQQILSESVDELLDLTYDEGILIKLALSSNNSNILKNLLDYYYDQNELRQKPEEYNIEQQLAKHKLFEILQDAVISEDMQKVLDEYGLVQNDDNSSTYSNEEIKTLFIKKSHSMDDIRTHSNVKNSYSTHEHSDEELLATKKCSRRFRVYKI